MNQMSRRDVLALVGVLAAEPLTALAQDPVSADPHSYRIVFENAQVRILEYQSQPGFGICGAGKHSHPGHATVQLTPAKVRLTSEDGSVKVVDVPANSIFWENAVTHTTENVGGSRARAFMVEIKDANWKPSTGLT